MLATEKVIARVAFEIVSRAFLQGPESARNSIRIKNLTLMEISEFIKAWELLAASRDLERVRLLVASDATGDYPESIRADPTKSITYYRNNNEFGLVYIETKDESDEQGLKNLFTIRDGNFLDGTFDEGDDFSVPNELIKHSLVLAGLATVSNDALIYKRILEVLAGLNASNYTVPLRNFVEFTAQSCVDYCNKGCPLTEEEIVKLIGKNLLKLGMFPDEFWRQNESQISRRLQLNMLRASLAASATTDLNIERTVTDCHRTKFKDDTGIALPPQEQEAYRNACIEYCLAPSDSLRATLPYFIFAQIFQKDVQGLPLGDRVQNEIADLAPARLGELRDLGVIDGLNARFQDDARRFLESEPTNTSDSPLREYLSKQTSRMVEKLATPVPERARNPLLKIAQIVREFRERNDLSNGDYRVELRIPQNFNIDNSTTIGLFAFLYGETIKSVCDAVDSNINQLSFSADERLIEHYPPPKLTPPNNEDTVDNNYFKEEDEDWKRWAPLPLEFLLVNIETGSVIDSEVAIEWLPNNVEYLALFWFASTCETYCDWVGPLRSQPGQSMSALVNMVSDRKVNIDSFSTPQAINSFSNDPIFQRLSELRSKFSEHCNLFGISIELLNNTFDEWSLILNQAASVFIPNGDLPTGMSEFLNTDCIQNDEGNQVLMIQTHPLKLRWIASYLKTSSQLAIEAIEGSLNLNPQNPSLYFDWIEGLSPYQQPATHASINGETLFSLEERGWTEVYGKASATIASPFGTNLNPSITTEIIRQVSGYLYAHPYKSDGLRIVVVTEAAASLPADIVHGVRKGEFKDIALTIDLIIPRELWELATREFELVDTDNRLVGLGSLFPAVQLNLHDLKTVIDEGREYLKDQYYDLAIVPQLLDNNVSTDAKTEDVPASPLGKFDPLLDDPTYIESTNSSSAFWVSLRPKMFDPAIAKWSTLVVRHERRHPVAPDRPDSLDFIDTRINFNNTARFFGLLHECSHWVIIVERHITRDQIETLDSRPEVLSLRDGIGPSGLFTLIVSSTTGKEFIIDRLTRKIARVYGYIHQHLNKDANPRDYAEHVYDEARQISPRLTLDALGISRTTEEILGLSVARRVVNKLYPTNLSEGFTAWISLDEHPEWFASTSTMRADMVRLSVWPLENGVGVDLLVLESKLRRIGYDGHGVDQVSKTLKTFESVLTPKSQAAPTDGTLWRNMLLSAVDTLSSKAVTVYGIRADQQSPRKQSRVPEDIRKLFRDGDISSISLTGVFSICEYSIDKPISVEEYPSDPRVKIIKSGGDALISDDFKIDTTLLKSNPPSPTQRSDLQVSVQQTLDGNEEATKLIGPEACVTGPISAHHKSEKSEGLVLGGSTKENDRTPSVQARYLTKAELDRRYQVILDTLATYGVTVSKTTGDIQYAIEGPASILFRVKPKHGVSPHKLSSQHDSLKLALALDSAQDIRFDIDKGYVTIDVPKSDSDRYFVSAQQMWAKWKRPEAGLKVPIGEDRFGNIVDIDFSSSNSPHLLIGGTTGSGKSEALNTILVGFTEFYSPQEVRLKLIDPKSTELEHFSDSEFLDGEIGWEDTDAIEILNEAVEEMQKRYAQFRESKVRSLHDYNLQASDSTRLPRWVIVLDEYADLTSEPEAKKTIEGHLRRLAQKARAAGIHLIIATQKPDASVISTNLRSNLPAQLALRVKSGIESRVIMDDVGAESLTGKGDAFLKESGVLTRVQCAKV